MRYSTENSDPGFSAWRASLDRGETIRVFLNDAEQKYAVTADDEIGYVRRRKLDEDGFIYAVGDEIANEDLYGDVRFLIENA